MTSSSSSGVVLALVVTACTATSDSVGARGGVISTAPSVAMTAVPGAEVTLAWRNTELHPIGQPVAIAGLAVGMVTRPGGSWLVGLDPETGKQRWEQPITPSSQMIWDPIGFAKVGEDQVAYYRPTGTDSLFAYAELVIADARTGADRMKSPAALFMAAPHVCEGGRAVCTLTEEWDGRRREHGRLDLATGTYATDSRFVPLRASVMPTGDPDTELLDLGDTPDSTMAVFRNGGLLWHRRFSELFPRGFSTAVGGRWDRHADDHVIVGSIHGGRWDKERWIIDLAHDTATVALDEQTGKTRWRDRGSTVQCIGDRKHPVRCRSHGTIAFRRGGGWAYDGLEVTVEGFDPATGKTTWSVPVGAVESLAPTDALLAVAGETKLALGGRDGVTVLDYATGTTTTPAPGTTFWCYALARYEFPALWYRGVRWGDGTRPGGRLAFLCDGRDHAATAPASADATFAAGAKIGNHVVIATRDGFLGFQREAAPAEPAAPPAEPAAPSAEPAAPPAAIPAP